MVRACAFLKFVFLSVRGTGGIEAEQAMRARLNEEEHNMILDSVNALMKLRQKNHQRQDTPPSTPIIGDCCSGDCGADEDDRKSNSTDKLIVTKAYYDANGSSDDSSADESEDSEDLTGVDVDLELLNDRRPSSKEIEPLETKALTDGADVRSLGPAEAAEMGAKRAENVFVSGTEHNVNDESNPGKSIIIDYDQADKKDNGSSDTVTINDSASCKTDLKTLDNGDEKQNTASQVLSVNGLHALKIISDSANDRELDITTSRPARSSKTEETSIRLPWQQPCTNEECHIKKRSE